MPINYYELMEALTIICNEEQLYVNMKSSAKGGLIAGLATMTGGVLLGPVGLAIGGTIGGLMAYSTSNDFKPLSEIITKELTEQQKDKLYNHIINGLRSFDYTDVMMISALCIKGSPQYDVIMKLLKVFFEKQMQMSITSRN